MSAKSNELSRYNTGSFNSVGVSEGWPISLSKFNFSVWGNFIGAADLERSFDGGKIWVPRAFGGSLLSVVHHPMSVVLEEIEIDILYRVKCSTLSAGVLYFRLSQ